ncbi:MAG TPA: glycosyltransferase [Cyclobacteriaceae bacterium]|nr:glycosyltransferase [Cyclobacteriaceae bacterium]
MKRVLYFFPENPLENNAGNKTRALQLLRYFEERNFKVDFVSLQQGMSKWNEEDIEAFKRSGLAENIQFIQKKPSKDNRIKYLLDYKIPNQRYKKQFGDKSSLNTDISINKKRQFESILQAKKYDYIIISYLYWADLINTPLVAGAKTIVDTHDFLTLHHKGKKGFQLGPTFEDEIEKLNLFCEAWSISSDEQFVFGQFSRTKLRLIPPYFDPPQESIVPEKVFDLIYVASDNPHNIRSARWFFGEVYPLLSKKLNICVIGRICAYIGEYSNVRKLSFVEHLDDFYRQSKISICPMLSGTGVKIKVVEALSYGLPIVCTVRGIDGLPNKINNGCLVDDDPTGFAHHISRLLQHADLYRQQSEWGKALFNSFFTKQAVFIQLDRAFEINDHS